jgi:hypothetical protein
VDRAGRAARRADAGNGKRHTMNVLLWVVQILAALLYAASGVIFPEPSAEPCDFQAIRGLD